MARRSCVRGTLFAYRRFLAGEFDGFFDVVTLFFEELFADVEAFALDDFLRAPRPCGASLTGSLTMSDLPVLTWLERNAFQRRSCSTLTPKRSATVMSVSPLRMV